MPKFAILYIEAVIVNKANIAEKIGVIKYIAFIKIFDFLSILVNIKPIIIKDKSILYIIYTILLLYGLDS